MTRLLTAVLLSLAIAGPALAKVEVLKFETAEQEETYNALIAELRCLVCQNQNLADSNAELAVDLRRKTYQMVQEGRNQQEIASYMVDRYGEFVLYRPPLNSSTLLLWTGPFIILLIGVALLVRTIVRRRREPVAGVDETRLKAAAELLETDPDKRDA